MATKTRRRCAWAGEDPAMIRYHDQEWGRPQHDDQVLFEFLTLEGAQAGLSWSTILRKREHYQAVFHRFDPKKVARMGAADVRRLMQDAGIVRNRAKLESTVDNARAFLKVCQDYGTFDRFIWGFAPSQGTAPRTHHQVPAQTPESDAMSKALKARGFRFVGSTICYAFMQACGLVDDHTRNCFRARAPRRG